MVSETFPSNTVIVRGGIATAAQLANGCGDHLDHPGIHGFSVQAEPGMEAEELARAGAYPNAKISVTTVKKLRDAGYDIVRTKGRGFHATVVVPRNWHPPDASKLAGVFEVESNPARRKM